MTVSLSPFIAVLLSLLASTLRTATPLILAATGGFFSERSGIINIALEGLMLVGAFASAAVAHQLHSPWLGFFAGAFGGMLLALIYGLAVIPFRANQVVAGTAINFLAAGVVPILCKAFFGVTGSTPALSLADRFSFQPVVVAMLLVVVAQLLFLKTSAGLWLSFAGEHPDALSAAGVRVNRVRWVAVLTSGALAGLAGGALSTFLASGYSRNMTAGRGFMALAALVLGKWRPVPAALACMLFAFAEAIQTRLQGVVLWGVEPVPVQFIHILPYVVTVIVLAGLIGESRPPKALGNPHRSS